MPVRTMVGQVRYSTGHDGFNILRFITTKRPEFELEQEVRALVWHLEVNARNSDPQSIPPGMIFPVDLPALVNMVIISPSAPACVSSHVKELLVRAGVAGMPVVPSGFIGYGHLLPTVDDIRNVG